MKQHVASVELHGGPMDGHCGTMRVLVMPGKFPLLEVQSGKWKYIYQAMQFLEDAPEPIRMEYVQMIGRHEAP